MAPSLCRGALQFKSMHCAAFHIHSVCPPSPERHGLNCCLSFGLLQFVSRCNNTQNYCLNVSITWLSLKRAYSGRDGPGFHCVLICVVPARGTHGSRGLINQADTRWHTRLRQQHWDALWTPFLLLSPVFILTGQEMTRLYVGDVSIHSYTSLLFQRCSLHKLSTLSFCSQTLIYTVLSFA